MQSREASPVAPATDTILRFRRSERHFHWSIAIPFVVCFATAAVLVVVYNPEPTRPYRAAVSIAHRVSGVCMIVFPLIAVLRHRGDFRTHLQNVRQGWVWTINDLKWLCLMGLAAVSKKFELPEQGKFNAAEKLNFMMVMTFSPLFIVTGILIWLPGANLPAWLVHLALAALAAPLIFGHIFMATVNPGTRVGLRGMISGRVDREWAKHHYRSWYRENFEREADGPSRSSAIELPPADTVVVARCGSCRNRYSIVAWEDLLERLFSADPFLCPHCGADVDELAVVTESQQLPWLLAELERGGPTTSSRTDS